MEATQSPLHLIVEAVHTGTRLDRFVSQAVPDLSRSAARHLIDAGHIRVHNAPARASYPVRAGDDITVTLPPAQPSELLPEAIPLDIVYEDAQVVVVNKPAGMVVHPAAGHAGGTLVNALLARYPDMQVGSTLRPGLVHRLDRDTSGLLVVARNDAALRHVQDQQQARTMHKLYLAVVEGRMKQPDGTIDAPLGRHPTDRKRQAVLAEGRAARTHYHVREELDGYTLLEARLETGRTHQIRVHCAHIQRPVLGDALYGPRKPRALFGLTRQFLHAAELGFVLPSSGIWRTFSADLPADLAAVLAKLRRRAGLPHTPA